MKHVSILVPTGQASLVNIEGSYQILSQVNTFLKEMGKPPAFDIHLVGLKREVRQTSGFFTISPDSLVGEVATTDLIIIPALHGDQAQAIEMNQEFRPWIIRQYHQGAEVASLCIGAFFLASTGLLDGKPCSTHWLEAVAFRRMFPEVELVDEKILTESAGIYTSGGAYSYLNLLLHLVEKFAGRQIAILTAKAFLIDIDRSSQCSFMIFEGQKDHKDDAILKAQQYIEENFAEKITVEELADKSAMNRRTFERRFKQATQNTVVEYLQRVRIEKAKRDLEANRKNIGEVMYEVGYSDSKAFRNVFKKVTGMTPVEYGSRYKVRA